MKTINRRDIAAFGIALVASACAVGPDFHRPAAPGVNGYSENPLLDKTASADVTAGAAQVFVPGAVACRDATDSAGLPSRSKRDQSAFAQEGFGVTASASSTCVGWWTLFSSKPLDALIAQALKSNPDLQAAEASLRQAQENVYAGEWVLLPSADANASATHEKFSPAAFGEGTPSSLFTLYNSSVSVSYGIDIFGGARREVEELKALADVQRFQREAAYMTLTTNVVTAAVQEASLKAQVKATQDIVGFEQKQLAILNRQLELGAVPKSAMLAQQTALAQQEAALPSLEKQLHQIRTELKALTGHFPSETLEDDFDLEGLHLPEELPVSLPSALVEQRPDIKAAEAQMHAASAAIGVATAAMLPQITLTGSYGWETASFSKVFAPSTNVWNIGGGLVQPIFQEGELLHERRAAVAAYDKAEAQYRSTVLAAFKNVSDSLRALESDADALAAQDKAYHSASDNLDMARTQFKAGAISYLALLDAEHSYASAKIALVQAQAARFADTAALFQALGGPIPVSAKGAAQELSKIDTDKLCTVGLSELDPAQPLRGSQDFGKEKQ